MNLFEIENEIMNCWDQETGEILDSDRLDQLKWSVTRRLRISLFILKI